MTKCHGYAAHGATTPLVPFAFERRDLLPRDVRIHIQFCGVCHSDLHQVRGHWPGTVYPIVPGHEIIGQVTAVGSAVRKFRAGQRVGVGCLVDSCGQCPQCREGLEQYCVPGFTLTYNSPDPHTGKVTYGGYSDGIVVDERFVVRVPDSLDPAAAAPLLCAGISTYSPLRHWNVGKGMKVGILGLGGLGHMGVQLAHAMGAHTVLFTSSPSKVADGHRLGADEVVIHRDDQAMKRHADSFDFLLNTVSAALDLNVYLNLLRLDGTLCLLGAPDKPHVPPDAMTMLIRRRRIAGSCIGGIAETQEVLDFCAEHRIACGIEMIRIQQINEAYERMLRNDVKYRFVIDTASLKG